MWLMSLHQSPETTSDGRTAPTSDSWFTLGHNKCRLHHRATRIQWMRLHHGRSWLCHQMESLCKHGYHPFIVGAAQLYIWHIWKHHGLPQRVVSDRGPQFVAEFTKEIYWLLGIKLAAITVYHPQGNGQMERINQELEQFLWLFIN